MKLVWTFGHIALIAPAIGCGSVNGADLGGAGDNGSGAGAPVDTFAEPSVCESHRTLPLIRAGGTGTMDPGMACISCHGGGKGPSFVLGGTVFATGHVPDRCDPTGVQKVDLSRAQVIITDANGTVYTLPVNSVGNFHSPSQPAAPLAFPYSAKVVYMGRERHMLEQQSTGDCNACHTESGQNGAPGRIALPE